MDERVIADEVLGVRRGHHKDVKRIIKDKRKASETFYATLSYRSQSQAAEKQCRLDERVDAHAQHHEIDAL